MKIVGNIRVLVAALALVVGAASAHGQTKAAASAEAARARAALAAASEEYKASTRALVALKEKEVARAEQKHEQLRQLVAEGLVARRELEAGEQALAESRAALEVLRNRIGDADRVVAEAEAAELAGSQPGYTSPVRKLGKTNGPVYSATAVVLRHAGAANWTAANLSGVQTFFASTFGRPLPMSAVGQTNTHDRMGFNHSRAVDVALHPDSPEGRALINYLHANGISFIAFRAAVPGSATGPHIHIGPPSHRI